MEKEIPVNPADCTKPAARAKGNKKKKRKWIKRIIIAIVILLFLAAAAWYAVNSLKTKYTVTYQPYSATTGTISNSLSFSGTLAAVNSQTCTAGGNGTVREIYVSAGDTVQKGDKLMRLSTGQTVKAEIDGTINEIKVSEGAAVSAGDTLCDIVDFKHLKTSIRVDEYDINSVHVGDRIRVSAIATDKTFDSAIASINHTSSSGGSVAYYTTTAYVDVDEGVYPGMQITVTLTQEEAVDVVILKETAISFDEENKAFVYTQGESGEMEKTYITTGVSNGNYVEITGGLKAGDTVYAQVTVADESAGSNILNSIFGGTRITGMPGGSGTRQNTQTNRNNNTGNRPSSGGFGGGNR